jgi:hypothetical protein
MLHFSHLEYNLSPIILKNRLFIKNIHHLTNLFYTTSLSNNFFMPPKYSTSFDNRKCSSSNNSEDAPSLTTIMSVLDHLSMDIKNLSLAISTTNTQLDTKAASVSTLLETLHDNITSNLYSLHSDVSTNFDDDYLTVDRTLTSACSEWRSDIDLPLTSLRSEWHFTIEYTYRHFDTHITDTSLHFDTLITKRTDKISTFENLCL